jgi:hypothetical protein
MTEANCGPNGCRDASLVGGLLYGLGFWNNKDFHQTTLALSANNRIA